MLDFTEKRAGGVQCTIERDFLPSFDKKSDSPILNSSKHPYFTMPRVLFWPEDLTRKNLQCPSNHATDNCGKSEERLDEFDRREGMRFSDSPSHSHQPSTIYPPSGRDAKFSNLNLVDLGGHWRAIR